MCGISGILMYPKKRTEQELEYIRELSGSLAVEIMARGTDATGIAIFNKDKGNETLLKHNVSADELTSYATWVSTLEKNINQDTTNILIHTRAATKGSDTNNDNNHPIVSATTIGIHNGMLWNDDDLFDSEKLFRQAEVDSEVIFRLADKLPTALTKKNIKEGIAEKIEGVFAVAMVKKQDPSKLHYFRNNNPTTFAYIPQLNVIVFASLEGYIKSALETTNLTMAYTEKFAIDTEEVVYMSPKENIIMQFNVAEDTPIEQMFQTPLEFEDNYGYGYGRLGGWWDDEEYYYGKSGQKHTKNSDSENAYDFLYAIEERLDENEFNEIMVLLDKMELEAWNNGYRQGRESTENDIKVREESAYLEGFSDGLKESVKKEAN